MGNYISRRTGGVEELDLSSSNAFHYPPRNGYFYTYKLLFPLYYY